MKVLLQDEMSECGLVCIAMIAEHYGKNKSISELRRNYKLDRNGLSFLNIETIFSEQEISACSYELKFENLHELTLPSIIQWNHNHFVVLSRIGNKYIEVYDPAIGKKRYDIDIAKQMFSGFAINVEPPLIHEGGERIRNRHSLLSFTLRLNKIRIWCIYYCCLIFFSQVFSLITPKYLSLVVDKVLPSSDHELLIFMSLGFAFVYIFDFLNNLTSNFLRSRIVFKIGKALSIESFNKLIKQDYRYFKTRNLADIIKRTTFISDYGSYLLESYINSSMNIVFSIIFYGLILYIDTNAFIIVAIISFLFAIVRLSLVNRFEMLQGSLISNESSRNEAIKNIFDNIKTIKVNKAESSVLNQISKINNQCLKRFCNILVLEENGKSLYLLTNNVCTILLVYCYLQTFFINAASVGNLFLLFFYKEFLFRNIASAVESVIYINKHKYEVNLASEIIFSSTEVVSYKKTAGDHDKIRKIEIKKGCLSYSSFSEPIFSDLNLILNGNHKVAITGRSGAGKSSLLTVLSSINRLSSGDFLVNNIPLDTFGIYEYRRKVGVYFSDEELKNETILKNITDDEFYDDNLLFEVLEKVGLNDEINSFHAGLYTLLGQGGVQLSSGQKQRLMIARALFKKPDVLLLDEPTSFLDEYNTSLICKIISEFDGLCLVVSHDSRLLSCCDVVYNLKDLDGV